MAGGIVLTTNFDVNTGLPLDSRAVVADLTARDAIPALVRYIGLPVFVVSEAKNFQLATGIDNTDWVEFAGGGGGGGVLAVADLTGRNTIPDEERYAGLIVHVVEEQTNFQLIGGILNANWKPLMNNAYTEVAVDEGDEIPIHVFNSNQVIQLTATVDVTASLTPFGYYGVRYPQKGTILTILGPETYSVAIPENNSNFGVEGGSVTLTKGTFARYLWNYVTFRWNLM